MKINVSIIVVDEDKVLIMRRPDTDRHFPGHWGIPGGGMDDSDDSIERTAEREVMEELGLEVNADKLIDSNKHGDVLFLVVDGWLEEGSNKIPTLSSEAADYKWASLSDIKKLEFTPFTKKRIIDYMSNGRD